MRYTQRQPGWASSSAPPQGSDVDYLFTVDNRGKRSITVDMKQEEGQRVVRRLASKCDVLLTNLLPERLAKFNLDSETLQKENPGLIYAVVSPWGLSGADMDNPGFDMTAFFARGGQMSINGPPGTAPVVPRPGQGDHTTGLAALSAILAALRLRDQTGRGTVVETSLLRTSAWQIAADMSTALIDGEQPKRADRTAAPNPLSVYYQVQGGRFILAMMPFNDAQYWPRFCEAAGKPEWGSKYLRRKLRAADGPAIMEELDRIFGSFSLDTAKQRLTTAGCIFGVVATLPEVVSDPQFAAAGAIARVPHPAPSLFPAAHAFGLDAHGSHRTVNAPFSVRGADVRVRGRAPMPGEHTEEVLLGVAGMGAEEVQRLVEAGVLRFEPPAGSPIARWHERVTELEQDEAKAAAPE